MKRWAGLTGRLSDLSSLHCHLGAGERKGGGHLRSRRKTGGADHGLFQFPKDRKVSEKAETDGMQRVRIARQEAVGFL